MILLCGLAIANDGGGGTGWTNGCENKIIIYKKFYRFSVEINNTEGIKFSVSHGNVILP